MVRRLQHRVRRTPVWALVVDGWDARRCGKSGIPSVGVPLTPTGRQSEIWRCAGRDIARLRSATAAGTRADEAELRRLRERLEQLGFQILAAETDEASILATPLERLPVEQGVPDAVVSARRARDNRRLAAPVRARIDQLTAERDQVALQAAEIDHEITMRWRAARAVADAVREVARRREARYFRLLCRRHPDGVRLADLFDHARPGLPGWVDGPHDERSL